MAELPTQARVVVIGGGIVGCSTAYHLAKLGWTDTVLVEKHKLTSGSTFHAAGLVGQLRTSANITQLLGNSVELYQTLEAETGQATGWKMNGGLRLACNQERWTEVKRQATTATCFGLEMHLLSPKEAQDLWPLMEVDDVVGAAFLPTDGQANPSDITMALAKGARMHGVTICEDTEVAADRRRRRRDQGGRHRRSGPHRLREGRRLRRPVDPRPRRHRRRERPARVGGAPVRHHRASSSPRCRATCRRCATPTGSPTTRRRSAVW